jgi:hypothetical protein
MKLLCSADYHIKLNTKNIPNEWAKSRFHKLFDMLSLLEIDKKIDLHLVMGDFFDRSPSLEELELYYEFVATRQVATFIIPGNHEALKKNTTFLTYLKSISSKINPKVRVVDDYYSLENIDFIPYNKLKEYAPNDLDFHGDILITHVRGDIPPHVKAEIDLSLLDRWKVVLAGDLHSYENSQRNILYPGSPVTTSFHRRNVSTGVILFDTNDLSHTFLPLDLPQLIRKTIQAGDAMPKTSPDHTIYEIEGDMSQLSEVEDHELMDKKVVKRSIDTALILSPEMSIEEEVTEYLRYVLMLPDTTINEIMGIFNDYSKEVKMG